MSTPRRPSVLNRALSTPPMSPNSPRSTAVNTPSKQQIDPAPSRLTPPTSPRHLRSSSHLSDITTSPPPVASQLQTHPVDLKSRYGHLQPIQTDMLTCTTATQHSSTPRALECPFNIEILKDERGRDAYFGTGAWSIVYKATTHAKQRHTPPTSRSSRTITPPHSPMLMTPVLVAVKKPTRRDAADILKSEANTLRYLHTVAESERFIVPFYGVINTSTLILGAIPYSLEEHIRRCAFLSITQQGLTSTSTEPIIGSTSSWLTLAQKLTTALAWLHMEAGVVHGDIKPGNILLSPNPPSTSFPYTPILADFSSSQLLSTATAPNPPLTPNTLSAVTREFTAPELLSSAVLRDPNSAATRATDVFSLAVTLLVAATGQLLVYPGSVFQRQAMATQGWGVLGFVRNGEGGMRVPRAGVVERVCEGAVKKDPAARIGVRAWVSLVEEAMAQEDGTGRL
ncbi:serine/threonine protein kinase [Exophiala aquamarina CBS 119918]|uniref:Serine/threonine protein kinase n=1 Tax=Exophiala aquamarina CBS 119918 TaxID=1182545 RepID=A0A072PRY1_9EURO|nr:serine/threonine protein kinase [Exophiala aquamarina CBS 119918]KEF62527.1 serine/threonine protein kinase [Exophiala aquamarina CBS 119918]